MKTSLDFLKKANDFAILKLTTFQFNFNEYCGGSFEQKKPEKVFAYNVVWQVKIRWINKAAGDYCYEYYSDGEPALPKKVVIEKNHYSMTGWQDTEEVIRFYGKPIFSHSDDWGRKNVIWLSEFENELELCENEEQVLKKINQIQQY